MLQTYRGACIAGKPAPTSAHKPLANAPICPCGRRLAGAASDKPGCLHRWQASSHKCTQALGQCTNMPMWQPACRRCFRHTAAPASLASQLPQVHTNHGPIRPVGAGLPAMAAQAACYPCQPPPSAAYTSTNDNDTWAVLSTSAAWLASNAFCTVNTFRKSTVPWAYC